MLSSEILFQYRDKDWYIHHTRTEHPQPEDARFRSHSHNMCEIYYFLSGEAEFVVEGIVHPLTAGTLILTDRGQIHNIRIRSSDVPYERFAILFSANAAPHGFRALFDGMRNGRNQFLFSPEERQWMRVCMEMLESNGATQVGIADVAAAVAGTVLAKAATMENPSIRPTDDALVREIIRFIDNNLSENWHLEDLEKALFHDQAYLNRRFRQVMGCGIWEYTLRRRVFAAQQTLYKCGNVAEAYRISGFQDYSAFYRRYKKYIGCSPMRDLKNMQIKS